MHSKQLEQAVLTKSDSSKYIWQFSSLWFLNVQDSLKVLPQAMVDTSVRDAVVYAKFQFERNGYFSVDPDTKPGQVCSALHAVSQLQQQYNRTSVVQGCACLNDNEPFTRLQN